MASDVLELTLTTLVYGGEAMGRDSAGRAIFVPFGLPGERVRVRIIEERKHFARATLLEVLQPSPNRIPPRCQHFFDALRQAEKPEAACGGCHYQHLAYADQLSAKTEILRDQLTRIGKIPNPPVKPIVPSPVEWNYRNHVQFHLDEQGRLGFISSDRDVSNVLPVLECHLPQEALNALWPHLQFEPGMPLERIGLRAGDEVMLVLEADSPHPPEVEIEAEISVVHLNAEGDALVLAGDDHILLEVLGRPFRVSAGSFFQVNTPMAEKMVQHVLDLLPKQPIPTIFDVYCGVGLFSAFLARRCERLIGIELSPSACADFVVNLDEFENVELYQASAEAVLPSLQVQPTLVLLDPPRAGLEKTALDALMALRPDAIVYVSCDPSTLARDLKRMLEYGYHLQQVTPFDVFPQTYHIESISLLTR
ncbi:MAG: 23S rRNA (uracil(1939)-C(5))-methyltransferase RlmD [Anaerolineae bacterium]|nr:MAG: 23S rRNA (uracil(1939)-C(5))-methyltransferase RlmD [Anaerolineae bacterium]